MTRLAGSPGAAAEVEDLWQAGWVGPWGEPVDGTREPTPHGNAEVTCPSTSPMGAGGADPALPPSLKHSQHCPAALWAQEGVCGSEVGTGLEGHASGTCLGAVDQDTLTPQAPGLPLEGLPGERAVGLGAVDGRRCPLIAKIPPKHTNLECVFTNLYDLNLTARPLCDPVTGRRACS